MAIYPPLTHNDVIKILKNLGFTPRPQKASSHQTWVKKEGNKASAVTLIVAGRGGLEYKAGTLQSIIRQTYTSKKEFYNALKGK